MSGEPQVKTHQTTSFQSRFDDTPLAFSMKRYEHRGEDAIWFFSVRRYCGGNDLIRIEATEKALVEMQRFINSALATVRTKQPEASEDDGAASSPSKGGADAN